VALPLPPVLSSQLGLPDGFGLFVQNIAPGSPAAKAGLQKFDVIKLLNDQQIVDQGQLGTLVNGIGTGKEVTLTILRKGQEQKVTATLAEHTVPVRGEGDRPRPGMHGAPGAHSMFGEKAKEWLQHNPEKMKEMQERMREFQKRMHDRKEPREGGKPGASIDPERLLKEAQPAGGSQIRVETNAGSTTIDGSQAHLRLKDQSGEIEIASENGKRVMTARDPEGKVVFTGPVNTEDERAAIPVPLRRKLAEIRIRQDAAVRAETGAKIVLGDKSGEVEERVKDEDFQ
jgi:hypothetical protein